MYLHDTDVKGASVSVRLRLRVSHECAWRWFGFAAAWGASIGATRALIPGIIIFKPPL